LAIKQNNEIILLDVKISIFCVTDLTFLSLEIFYESFKFINFLQFFHNLNLNNIYELCWALFEALLSQKHFYCTIFGYIIFILFFRNIMMV